MALVRRWWLRRITHRPDYVAFNRGISPVSRAWHCGLGLNNYVLYSILWAFGPIRCVYEAELVLGLFFRFASYRLSKREDAYFSSFISEIEKAMERDRFFDPEEAQKFGLIDKVITTRIEK